MQGMSTTREDMVDPNTSIDLTTNAAALATAPTHGIGIKAAAAWKTVVAEEAALSAVEGAIEGEALGCVKCCTISTP